MVFFLNGINALLGWNAVVAALDYFQASFMDYNIYSFLPVPLFIAYLLVDLLFQKVSNQWTYLTIIVTGNIIINISMVGLFLVSILLEQTLAGFVLTLVCSFGIGLGANLSHLTFFAMINYLSW